MGNRANESASIIRGINETASKNDKGFMKELKMLYGEFDLSSDDKIVLGSGLASALGTRVGGQVSLFALGAEAMWRFFRKTGNVR